jgi:hypothetical protein
MKSLLYSSTYWRHDPKGLQRYDIHNLYNETLQPHLSFSHATVVISRPINLKDILTRAALLLPDGSSNQNKIDILEGNKT